MKLSYLVKQRRYRRMRRAIANHERQRRQPRRHYQREYPIAELFLWVLTICCAITFTLIVGSQLI